MRIVLLILAAVAPALLLLWLFHSRDAFPEPRRVVWTTFALGVLSTVPVLIIAIPLLMLNWPATSLYIAALGRAFLIAAATEESFKLLVLLLYCRRHTAFDEPMDGLVYGVSASLGFATLENILYVADGGWSVAVLRAFTSVPGHAAFGAIMGYYVGLATFTPTHRRRLLLMAWLVPVLAHGCYDYPLMAASALMADHPTPPTYLLLFPAATIVVLIVAFVGALRLAKRLRRQQLASGLKRG